MKIIRRAGGRFLIAAGSILIYVLLFLLFQPAWDLYAAFFNVIPAATFGWLMGVPGGFFYLLIGLPLNIVLFNSVDTAYNQVLTHILGISAWTLISIGLGWMKDLRVLNKRIRKQALDLEAERQLLQEEIIRRRQAEDKLEHEALHDPLTDLPNRRLFFNRLAQAHTKSKQNPQARYAVLYLDVDKFKSINDSMGHEAGDLILKQVAGRLKASVREIDTVARMGGDEFAILLEDVSTLEEIEPIIKQLQKNLALPYEVQQNTIFSKVSIGIVMNIMTYERLDDILRDADTAMYQCKSNGGNQYQVFDNKLPGQSFSDQPATPTVRKKRL